MKETSKDCGATVGSDGRRRYDRASIDRLFAAPLEPRRRYRGFHGGGMSISCGKGYRAPSRTDPAASTFAPVQVGPDRSVAAAPGTYCAVLYPATAASANGRTITLAQNRLTGTASFTEGPNLDF